MSASHASGVQRGTRLGNNSVWHTIKLLASDFPNAGKKIFTIKASIAKPVFYRVFFYVDTVFTGTSPQILFGNGVGNANVMASGDITEGSIGFYDNLYKFYVTINTNLYALSTGIVSTGKGVLFIETIEVNTKMLGRST